MNPNTSKTPHQESSMLGVSLVDRFNLFADFNGIPRGVDKTEFYQHLNRVRTAPDTASQVGRC